MHWESSLCLFQWAFFFLISCFSLPWLGRASGTQLEWRGQVPSVDLPRAIGFRILSCGDWAMLPTHTPSSSSLPGPCSAFLPKNTPRTSTDIQIYGVLRSEQVIQSPHRGQRAAAWRCPLGSPAWLGPERQRVCGAGLSVRTARVPRARLAPAAAPHLRRLVLRIIAPAGGHGAGTAPHRTAQSLPSQETAAAPSAAPWPFLEALSPPATTPPLRSNVMGLHIFQDKVSLALQAVPPASGVSPR